MIDMILDMMVEENDRGVIIGMGSITILRSLKEEVQGRKRHQFGKTFDMRKFVNSFAVSSFDIDMNQLILFSLSYSNMFIRWTDSSFESSKAGICQL